MSLSFDLVRLFLRMKGCSVKCLYIPTQSCFLCIILGGFRHGPYSHDTCIYFFYKRKWTAQNVTGSIRKLFWYAEGSCVTLLKLSSCYSLNKTSFSSETECIEDFHFFACVCFRFGPEIKVDNVSVVISFGRTSLCCKKLSLNLVSFYCLVEA